MITVELFIVNCIASNLNWKDKTITIRHNIKYITINIKHLESKYDCSNSCDSCDASRIALPFTYSELSDYWFNNIDKYSRLFNIDFNKLIIGIDYSIAPIYNSKNNSDNSSKQNIDTVNENIVIGIFILDTKSIKYLDNKQIKPIGEFTKYEFISQIAGNDNNNNNNKNIDMFNILGGIIDYQQNKVDTTYSLLDKLNICIPNLNNYKLNWKIILKNARNYLPKLDTIVIKESSRNLLNP